ncbi:MAG: GTP-binding protein [Candidatus Lokiarchaeota archaeon]|nr:GTP-binding protein [Candidatus Lokiarchaeota archaeon]
MKIKVALIGNPNVGKSVIFNNLTGSRQHTGNWPGKTVEKKEGYYTYKGYEFEVVDLPGVYSLNALSDDERVAREYLIDHRPDIVVDIVNAGQLERNLYLTLLLIEYQLNLIIVLNMQDVVRAKGDRIDTDKLSEILRAPIVSTTATKKKGMEELKEEILRAVPVEVLERDGSGIMHPPGEDEPDDHLHYHPRFHHHGEYERLRPPAIKYDRSIERQLKRIVAMLEEEERSILDRFPPRWLALRILERDPDILSMIQDPALKNRLLEVVL